MVAVFWLFRWPSAAGGRTGTLCIDGLLLCVRWGHCSRVVGASNIFLPTLLVQLLFCSSFCVVSVDRSGRLVVVVVGSRPIAGWWGHVSWMRFGWLCV